MRKVFYDSWIAKHCLLPYYSTITLFAWVFTKYKKEEVTATYRQGMINHECVHTRQWAELTIASAVLLWVGMLVFGYSALWLIPSIFTFYILYVLEYLIRRLVGLFIQKEYRQKSIYRLVSFEKEARLAERDSNYLENSGYFAFLNYIF